MAAKAKPGDVTGRKREELAELHVEEVQKRAEEMSLATAQAAQKLETEVINSTTPTPRTVVVEEVLKTGEQKDTVVVRIVETVEAMTFGAGNHYSFKAGEKHEVTKAVANHLINKGYAQRV